MTITDIAQVSVPLDVIDFAEKKQVLEYLGPIIKYALSKFPDRNVRVYLEEDPEIEDDARIVVDANVNGLNADERYEAYRSYKDSLFDICPPSKYACVFVFRMSV